MIPLDIGSSARNATKTIQVMPVTGGEKTNPMVYSRIEDEGFEQALNGTLQRSGLFKEINPLTKADYVLYAAIIGQEIQSGLSASTILFVNYKLIATATKEEIWKENIVSQYDAQFDETFYGPERARRGNEGAVRDNLKKLIARLSAVITP